METEQSDETKRIDDGGSAFPCEGGKYSELFGDPGMSLRDWFAGMALARMMGEVRAYVHKNNYALIADAAYAIADAMIERRKR